MATVPAIYESDIYDFEKGWLFVDGEWVHTTCEHRSATVEFGGPESRSGRGRTWYVCEDCHATLGQAGWDSVL